MLYFNKYGKDLEYHMGKNKKSTIKYKNISLDSTEELQFIYWLDEGIDAGLIKSYKYQPTVFNLFENVIAKNANDNDIIFIKEHIYTPDFSIVFTKSFLELYNKNKWYKSFKNIKNINDEIIVDVKGTFSRNGGDRVFSINQKWVYQKYNVYIHKIIPFNLFKNTWCPKLAKMTPKKGLIVKKYSQLKEITDILKGI